MSQISLETLASKSPPNTPNDKSVAGGLGDGDHITELGDRIAELSSNEAKRS